jgi:hypothetical protein
MFAANKRKWATDRPSTGPPIVAAHRKAAAIMAR